MLASIHFFVDRSLGRWWRVPAALQAAGWSLTTLAQHYGVPADEAVDDVDWLALAGERGWAVLKKDDHIRQRPAEVAALRASGVHAFCIANANLTADQQVELFLKHEDAIASVCVGPGPTLHSISRSGMRAIAIA